MHDDSIKRELEDLRSKLDKSEQDIQSISRSLTNSLAEQEQVLEKAKPERIESEGWILLGTLYDSKQAWNETRSKNKVVDLPVSDIQSGRKVMLTANALLYDDPTGKGMHASARVLDMVRKDEPVEIIKTDPKPLKAGGYFLWAKVKRLKSTT